MSKVIDFPNREAIYEAAAFWLVRMDVGELNVQELQEFKAWLATTPEHVTVFKDTLFTWEGMTSLHSLSEYFPLETLDSFKQARAGLSSARNWFLPVSAVASLAVIGILVGVYLLSTIGVYQTKVGERATVQLSDGSVMTLNTDTKLKVSYAEHVRRIDLLRGEAFFEVEKDPKRPFLVVSDENVVTAVGTAFSVFREKNSFKVVVSEGIVQLQSSEDISNSAKDNKDSGVTKTSMELMQSPVYLKKGEVGYLDHTHINVEMVSPKQIEQKLSWREDMLVFDGESLDQVVQEFQRYTNTQLLVDDKLNNIRVGGYFKSNDVQGMLASLESNFGVQVVQLGNDRVLLK